MKHARFSGQTFNPARSPRLLTTSLDRRALMQRIGLGGLGAALLAAGVRPGQIAARSADLPVVLQPPRISEDAEDLTAEAEEALDRAEQFMAALDEAGSFSPETGRVKLDEGALAEVLSAYFEPEYVEPYLTSFRRLAEDGLAVAGGADQVVAASGGVVAWSAFESFLHRDMEILGDDLLLMLEDLGLAGVTSIDDAAAVIASFPTYPDRFLEEPFLNRIVEAAHLAASGSLVVAKRGLVQADFLQTVADGLAKGEWSAHWWGWRCRLSRATARSTGDALKKLSMVTATGLAMLALAKVVSAGVLAIVAAVLEVYAFLIGVALVAISNSGRYRGADLASLWVPPAPIVLGWR
jgi:hypothetical protein